MTIRTPRRGRFAVVTNSLLFRRLPCNRADGNDCFTPQLPDSDTTLATEPTLLPDIDFALVQSGCRAVTRFPPGPASAVVAGQLPVLSQNGRACPEDSARWGAAASIVVRGCFWFARVHSRYGGSATPKPQEKTHGTRQRVSVGEGFAEWRLLALSRPPATTAFACPTTTEGGHSTPSAAPDKVSSRQTCLLDIPDRTSHNRVSLWVSKGTA